MAELRSAWQKLTLLQATYQRSLGRRFAFTDNVGVMSMLRSKQALTWITLDGAAIGLLLTIVGFVLVDDVLVGILALAAAIILFSTFLYLSRSGEEPLSQASSQQEVESDVPVHATTGLYRWWVFRDRVLEEIARAERQKRDLALVLLEPSDLTDEAADEARLQAANVLRRTVRNGDFFAQYDDDHFVVMLPEADANGARTAANRLLSSLRVSEELSLRWRAALVTYPKHGATPDELIDRAQMVLRPGRLESARRGS